MSSDAHLLSYSNAKQDGSLDNNEVVVSTIDNEAALAHQSLFMVGNATFDHGICMHFGPRWIV
jgi:hypothetical protein